MLDFFKEWIMPIGATIVFVLAIIFFIAILWDMFNN